MVNERLSLTAGFIQYHFVGHICQVRKNNFMELKSCPFCGGIPALESWNMSPYEKMNIENSDGNWYAVFCTACCAESWSCVNAADAENLWNTRVKEFGGEIKRKNVH